jgi:hypothetical protein
VLARHHDKWIGTRAILEVCDWTGLGGFVLYDILSILLLDFALAMDWRTPPWK